MKMLAALAVLAVAVPSADAVAAPAARKAPVKADWTKRVMVTPDGGFLVGNPAAKAKLVEYGSLSCPYCQRFHQEAIAGLRARIATGDVNFEFHPFAVHSADPILHALLRCAGPARFNKFSDDFYDGQATLAAAYEKWAEANPTADPSATAADRIAYADAWGFTAFAATHGLTRTQLTKCLSNASAIQQQRDRESQANKDLGVSSTPTFLLNGQKLVIYAWPDIDQAITTALSS
ncbi:DsbA family protein [Sphingomonas panacisoli]|nr:thioredoxin domain-containing protein [Sphingomonas panacisoli]